MTKYIHDLESEMRDALRTTKQNYDTLTAAARSADIVTETIQKLRTYIRDVPFGSVKEEIRYFKHYAPRFYGRLFYYLAVSRLALKRLHTPVPAFRELLQEELRAIEKFYFRQEDLFKIYYLKDNSYDERLFLRSSSANPMSDPIEIVMASDFCIGCYYASQLFCNLHLRKYVERELIETDPARVPGPAPRLVFLDGKTDAGEVILLLWVSKSFGNTPLKEIVEWFNATAGTKIENIHVIWQDLKRRKTGLVKYIQRGVELLQSKAEEELDK